MGGGAGFLMDDDTLFCILLWFMHRCRYEYIIDMRYFCLGMHCRWYLEVNHRSLLAVELSCCHCVEVKVSIEDLCHYPQLTSNT